MWQTLKNRIEEAVEQFVPKKQTRNKQGINPFGGTRKSKEPEGEKKQSMDEVQRYWSTWRLADLPRRM